MRESKIEWEIIESQVCPGYQNSQDQDQSKHQGQLIGFLRFAGGLDALVFIRFAVCWALLKIILELVYALGAPVDSEPHRPGNSLAHLM